MPAEVLVERLRTLLLSATTGGVAGHWFSALAQVDQLERLNAQLKMFDCRIADLFPTHPDAPVFASFPAPDR